MKKQIMFLLFTFLAIGAYSTTIYIPEDYTTIQEGIDASEDGDEIIVSPGTYVENIDFVGKAIVVGSLFYTTQDTSYISQTIIDGDQDGSVVIFENGEDSTSVLTGFTITNGYVMGDWHESYGGGILCNYTSPSLENVTITYNSAYYGGGIYCAGSSPRLENVTIMDNSATSGGGIYCRDNSNPSLENVTILGNSADNHGGGIYSNFSSPVLETVTIMYNSAESQGGGIYCWSANPSLENVTITNNSTGGRGGGIMCNSSSNPVFSSDNRCNIYLNNTNNRASGSDIYSFCDINVIVDTFTVSNPTDFHAAPIENFTFDILHGLQDQIN
ncbi:MAG: hypothetical protein K9N06_13700, partial [Candidatus Cloacimonetes bacterium]|nr:hypothetical protein [Candidatus Cloacimonadota bacterium]